MGHAAVHNETRLVFEALLLLDEECRPLVVPVVKGTFLVRDDGRSVLSEEQIPLNAAGETWGDDPETSSYKFEPEVAFFKPATDVALVGSACAPYGRATEMNVGLTVGSARTVARVYGDRVWFRSSGGVAISNPVPFEKMPLTYERAFGGWDKRDPDPNRHACEPRNPVGAGFRVAWDEGCRLPNIEHPAALIASFGDRPPPVGFGFVSPHWQPRAAFAGTYDEKWQKSRAPLLPADFDRRHLNAGSPGLVSSGYLRGDEPVTAMGVTPRGTWAFSLPGLPPPRVRLALRDRPEALLETRLDTVIIEPEAARVQLLWRTHAVLKNGPHDLRAIELVSSGLPS